MEIFIILSDIKLFIHIKILLRAFVFWSLAFTHNVVLLWMVFCPFVLFCFASVSLGRIPRTETARPNDKCINVVLLYLSLSKSLYG